MESKGALYTYVSCNKDNVRTKLCSAGDIQVPEKGTHTEHSIIDGVALYLNESDVLQESAILEDSSESVLNDVF